jgi:hypothetical protein
MGVDKAEKHDQPILSSQVTGPEFTFLCIL